VPQEVDLTQFVNNHPDLIPEDLDESADDASIEIDLTQLAHSTYNFDDDSIEIDLTQLAHSSFNFD
jgi:hypothetical protein